MTARYFATHVAAPLLASSLLGVGHGPCRNLLAGLAIALRHAQSERSPNVVVLQSHYSLSAFDRVTHVKKEII